MVDTVPPEVRSRIMSAVKSRDTSSEIAARRILHKLGFRYRVNVKKLPGKPDLVFAKWRAVLFVNGCFWHRHEGCRKATLPTSNKQFWKSKFERNVARDRRNIDLLQSQGWRVGILWECWIDQVPAAKSMEEVAAFLRDWNRNFAEWP